MSSLGSRKFPDLKKDKDQPLQRSKALVWEKPDPNQKFGKNIAIIGGSMEGKTNLALQFGFFNSEYTPYMKKHGFLKTIEVLDKGILAEVEEIIVVESENNLKKALNDGIEKALYRPLTDKGIIDIIPITIPRKEVKIKNKRLVNVYSDKLEEKKDQFVDLIKEIVDTKGENTLLIIDSMSKYKKLLDDRLGLIIDVVKKRANASLEGLDKYTQAFYAHRNTQWENIMEYKRGFKGWNIDTYKESKTPQQYVDLGAEPISTKWVTGTPHFLDMVYRVTTLSSGVRQIEIADGKGRYMPKDPKKWKFKYPLNSRMGAMSLIECMCDTLLLGEDPDDEKFW